MSRKNDPYASVLPNGYTETEDLDSIPGAVALDLSKDYAPQFHQCIIEPKNPQCMARKYAVFYHEIHPNPKNVKIFFCGQWLRGLSYSHFPQIIMQALKINYNPVLWLTQPTLLDPSCFYFAFIDDNFGLLSMALSGLNKRIKFCEKKLITGMFRCEIVAKAIFYSGDMPPPSHDTYNLPRNPLTFEFPQSRWVHTNKIPSYEMLFGRAWLLPDANSFAP